MKTTTEQPSCKWNLQWLFILICTTLVSTFSFGQLGTAPMQQLPAFPGLFAIDGFLQRQGANGDWLQAAGGSADNFVLTNAGAVAPNIKFAFLKRDLFNDQTLDEIFDGGNKLNDNPNDWGWRSQKPPGKDDINNAAGFLAINPINQHIWLAISGDRKETNGTSYIDFEFYQNEITRTGGPIPGGTGGFSTNGPHNGRTVGDLSLTLEFTGGGSLATVKYLQWQPTAEAGSYDYFPLNPPAGSAFAAANDVTVNVPYGAFGGTTYSHVQWAEGAVDLTALIGGTGTPGECGSQPFESLFIKTKSSATSEADLKDFIAPFGLNTCFDVTPPIITCAGTLNLGCNPTIPLPSGTTASDNCSGVVIPVSADGPVSSDGCSRSMTRIWRATDGCGNAATCGQQINWTVDNTGPTITTGGTTTTLGCNPSASDISAALGTATATDACSTPTVSAPSDGTVVSTNCGRSQTRTWTARDACSGITTTAARTVTWTTNTTTPTLTPSGGSLSLGCNPTAGAIDGALGSASATDACGNSTVTSTDGSVNGEGCSRSQTRTFRAVDACGNTSSAARTATWTVDVTGPTLTTGGTVANGANLGCNPTAGAIDGALGTATATDACSNPTVSAPSDGTVSSDGCTRTQTRRWTATDACGNTSAASRTISWIADLTAPVITTGGTVNNGANLGCNPTAGAIDGALGTATATDACSNPTVSAPSDGTVSSDGCTRTQTRKWTATDACGNTSTASRTISWIADRTAPVITTGGTVANGANLGCNPTAGAIDGALGTATATDACSNPTVSAPSDGTVSSEGCTRTQTRRWTATDACGNTSTASRTISWIADLTAPTITTGGTVANGANLGCNPTAGAIDGALGTATATDACSNPTVSAPSDGTVSSDGCTRTQTRKWTATDACGNTSTASRTISWIADLTAPTLTTGGTVANGANLGCNPTAGAIDGALGTATATDACSNPTVSAPSDGTVSSEGCTRTQTRRWTATDACGNTSTASRTISWIADLTAPTITTGGTVANGANLGCNPTAGAIDGALGTATATDACSNPTVSAPSDGTVSSEGCTRTQTRKWTATDACGNTSTASRTISWIADLTPPTLTTGGTVANGANLGCNPTAGAIDGALGTATATDACSNPTVSAPSDGTVSSDGCTRTQTRKWTATDACGNTSTASRTISWIADRTAPTLTTGGTVNDGANLGCNPSAGAIDGALGTATATDACSNPTVSAPSDGTVSSDGCTRTQTRRWTATDACGNTSTASRTISWIADRTAPTLTTGGTVNDGANLGCNPTAGAIDGALGTATATDACSNPTVSAPSDGTVSSEGCTRTQTRRWTATDACGNTSTASRTISWIADRTAPTLTTGGTVANGANLGCNPTAGAIDGALGTATATDACSNPTVSAPSDGTVSSEGCTRTQTRRWTATDACGNTSTASRTISWIADLTAPTITTGGTVANGANLGCNPTAGAIDGALGTATATDACSNPTVSAPSDGTVSSEGCTRTQTRKWTATDACGNTSTASRTISWIADLTAPTLTTGGTVANGANLGCNPTAGAIDGALGTATATDACSNPTVSAPSDGTVSSEGCTRTQTRKWTATDACGNTSTASRTISWIADRTAPTLTTGGTVNDGANLGCNPTAGAIDGALGTATATDACSNPTVSAPSDGTVSSDGCTRTQTRRWTATDACGNTSTASRTISWIADRTAPTLTTGGTVNDGANLGCNPSAGAIDGALGTATATDACSNPTVSAPSDGTVSSDGCTRTQTRRWTATDACGNTSTASRTISWIADRTAPTLTTGGTVANGANLGCNPTAGAIDGALGTATATDACSNPTVSAPSDGTVSSEGCTRTQTRKWTATDACGNTSTASRTISWIADRTAPTLTTGGTVANGANLGCNPTAGAIDGALGTATATDACSNPTVSAPSDGTVSSEGCTRTQTRRWTATDACGNTSTASRTISWIADLTAPTLTTGGTVANGANLGCNPSAGAIDGALGTATATDACSNPTVSAPSDGTVSSDGCTRTQTRRWTATDACGNTSTASRTISWIADRTAPTLTTGGTVNDGANLGCNPTAGAIDGALGTATATDACSNPTVSAPSDGTVSSEGCTRTQTRKWTATDACGNTSTASRTISWIADRTAPTLTTGGTVANGANLGCNPTAGAIDGALGTATATDACSNPTVSAPSDGTVSSEGCTRTQTRRWTATDACGNTSTASRTISWIADRTAPTLTTGGTVNDGANLGCNPTAGAIDGALGTATATDACSNPTVSAPSDGTVSSEGCTRTQTRKWTATDACGNTSTASRTISWIADRTAPTLTTGGTVANGANLGCNPTAGAIDGALGTATATDACSNPTVSAPSDGTVSSEGCTRTQTRRWTATDACGNTSTASRTISWIADLTAPTLTTGGTVNNGANLGCNPTSGAIDGALGTATATDACSNPTVSAPSDGTVSSDGCTRTQTRKWTATDACGNTSTASRTISWIADRTAPTLTTGGTVNDGANLGCNPSAGAIDGALGTATATDACSNPTVSAPSDGTVSSDGCTRTQTRKWTATDACGNTSTASRTISWIADRTAPTLTTGGTVNNGANLGCNPTAGAIDGALGTATATDACSNPTVSAPSDGTVSSDGCTRTQTRKWTATDACGNTSTASRTISWIADLTGPTFTTGGTVANGANLGCNPSAGTIDGALGTATATDACSNPTVSAPSDGTVSSDGCTRTQTRKWTARDACGNTSTASRTISWTADRTPPVFTTTPANVDVDCTAPVPSSVTPTASDACGTPTVTMTGSTDNPANCTTGFKRIVTRTWTAQDACGNTATYTQTIRVKCCETVCTLTQGAYGNAGGNICLPNGTTVNQTQIMINALTAAPGNMKVFGRQDLNRYWVVRLSDINNAGSNSNIFKMLPGGGPSGVFGTDNVAGVPEYSNTPSWPVVPLQANGPQAGKIRNQLFSQTLTLYFNTTIVGVSGNTLADVKLDGSLAVVAPRNCGSSDPAGPGTPTQLVSPAISNYLATHGYATTVGGLLQLANDALGGVNVSPLTLSQIQDAVGGINETFDECKIVTGYVSAGGGAGRVITSNSISSQPSLIVTAFPNPYEENFSLKINSPVTGQAAISFYTMDGVKIGEMKRDVVEKKDVWVPYNVPAVYRTRIVYTVTVGSYNAKGIVLSPN